MNSIQTYAKYYYSLSESERDINEWVPVLDTFIHNLCNKYSNAMESHEERYQLAWMHTLRALQTYDISKGVALSTYLYKSIANGFLIELRKINKLDTKNNKGRYITVSLYEKTSDVDKPLTYEHYVGIPDDNYKLKETIFDLNVCYNKCTNKEKDILTMILKNPSTPPTQSEIATNLGVTQSYVSRTLIRIKEKYYE